MRMDLLLTEGNPAPPLLTWALPAWPLSSWCWCLSWPLEGQVSATVKYQGETNEATIDSSSWMPSRCEGILLEMQSLKRFTVEANVNGNYVHLIFLSRTATHSSPSLRLSEVCDDHSYQSQEPQVKASSIKLSVSTGRMGVGRHLSPTWKKKWTTRHRNHQKLILSNCENIQKLL